MIILPQRQLYKLEMCNVYMIHGRPLNNLISELIT